MFNYITIAPDSKTLTSRSDAFAPFKVLALNGNNWDSYASAATFAGAVEALNIMRSRCTNKAFTQWKVVEATAVDYKTWEALHNA